jgi:oxygen-independent coproporphyrinogen-3 oxidase
LEVSIEIDPRSIDPTEIKRLADIGFNRFSIGVQDFAPNVQKAINRVQDERKTLEVIAAAREVSNSVNVDLITGLPQQTASSFEHTLKQIVAAGVNRVAAYNFAYLPERIKAQRLINAQEIPSIKERMELVDITRKTLLSAGYQHIGMDHFALSSDSLAKAAKDNSLQRNFQGYTTHATTDLIGVGASAISQFKYSFAQNNTQLSHYNAALATGQLPIARGVILDNDDVLRAHIIQEIMCRNIIDLKRLTWDYIETTRPISLGDYFCSEISSLDRFIDDGLVTLSNQSLIITPLGAYFRRQMAAKFDAYLASNTHIAEVHREKLENSFALANENVVKFSQTI